MYEKLRTSRIEKNLKGEEIAKMLGLTKSTYSKKENGLIKFSLDEGKKIADYLNMSIEEIFFDMGVSVIETKETIHK